MKKITYTIIGLCALTFTLSACHKDHDVTTADPTPEKYSQLQVTRLAARVLLPYL